MVRIHSARYGIKSKNSFVFKNSSCIKKTDLNYKLIDTSKVR